MREEVEQRPPLILQGLSRPSLKWLLAGTTFVATLTADLGVKALVQARLGLGVYHEVLPGFGVQHVKNTGVAFGLFSGQSGLIIAATMASVLVILAYIALDNRERLSGFAGGLLLGGSLGNLVERVASGEVTDFIRLPYWPNFNLADVFIVAGVALVAAGLLLPPGDDEADDRAGGEGGGGGAPAGPARPD